MAKKLMLAATSAYMTNLVEAQSDFEDKKWVTITVDVLEGIRGFWLGFNRGVYKRNIDAPLDEECLDDHTTQQFEDSMYIFAGDKSRGDWLNAIGNLTYVLANLNTCQFRKPFIDMINYCKSDVPPIIDLDSTSFLSYEHPMLQQNTWEPDMSSELSPNLEKCSWRAFLDNTSKNAFVLMGSLSDATQTAINFPGNDADNIYAQTLRFGEDCGTWVRVALAFTYI